MHAPVALLAAPDPTVIRLRLADPAYLFEGPKTDPLQGIPDGFSGLDRVRLALKRDWRRRDRIRSLELLLPAALADDAQATRMSAAIEAHVAVALADQEANRLLFRHQSGRAWIVGLVFLAACLVASFAVDRLFPADSFLGVLLRESLVIAGWVGLWQPLSMLLYDWWPIRFEQAMLQTIARLDVRVLADPDC